MDAISEDEAVKGAEVDFYLKPADKAPVLKTTIQDTGYERGKLFIAVEGVDDYYPFYHFKKSVSTINYGSEITNPLDDLHARLGM